MTRRVQTARINGSLGGKQSSRNLTEAERERRARNAGITLLTLYGQGYYSQLRNHKPKPKSKKHRKSALETPTKISTAGRRLAIAAGQM